MLLPGTRYGCIFKFVKGGIDTGGYLVWGAFFAAVEPRTQFLHVLRCAFFIVHGTQYHTSWVLVKEQTRRGWEENKEDEVPRTAGNVKKSWEGQMWQ